MLYPYGKDSAQPTKGNMTITYPRDTLLAVVAYMMRSGALLKKQTMPVLGYVKLDSGRITATNLDWALTYALPLDPHPDFLLPAGELIDLLKRADPRTAITFHFDADKPPALIKAVFFIRGRVTSFDLRCLQPEDFPPLPAVDWPGNPQVWGNEELAAIGQALECSSDDQGRYILNSVYADLSGAPRGRIVGTDGRRLYQSAQLAWMWLQKLDEDDEGFILPKQAIATVNGELKNWPWRVRRAARYFMAEAGPWTLFTKLVEAHFPNYRQVIPKVERTVGWRLTAEEAAECVDLIRSLIITPKNETVKLKLTAAGATAIGPVGNMQISLPGTVQIPNCYPEACAGLNPDYFCTALRHSPVLVTIAGNHDPVLFHLASGGVEVVMQVRLGDDSGPVPSDAAASGATAATAEPADDADEEPEEDEPADEEESVEDEEAEPPVDIDLDPDRSARLPDSSSPLPFSPGTTES